MQFYESYRVSKKINNLEITKKGLLKVFENDILYKEFFEFAVKKRSVEYAVSISTNKYIYNNLFI